MIEDQRLGLGRRMQVVGLKIGLLRGNGFKQKGQQANLLLAGNITKTLVEFKSVGTVIGRQADAGEHHPGPGRLRSINHGIQVVAHLCQWQATQTIIGAQGNDDDDGFVLTERRVQAGAPTSCGFAGDRQVGDAIIKVFFRQTFGEQGWPGLLRTNAVAGRKRVTHDQNGFGGECRGGREEQNQ